MLNGDLPSSLTNPVLQVKRRERVLIGVECDNCHKKYIGWSGNRLTAFDNNGMNASK